MASDNEQVVLFYTDNGFGLGHLTRQAAVASRSREAFRSAFLTMSAGYTLLRQLGFPVEYFPSYDRLKVSKQDWEPLMAERVLEAIRLSGARVVVVDHVSPPWIFESLKARTDGVKFVWARRGLWQPGKNRSSLELGRSFDLIVEPGDLASPIDHGPTARRRHETIPTAPIVLTDTTELLPRDEARRRLGIPNSGPALLINLGESDPSAVAASMSHARSMIDRLAEEPMDLFAPLHPLHSGQTREVDHVTMAPVYPVARYLNAFDGAISTAGYNSFHEIMGSALPAVFVPRGNPRIDDQARRAEFASLSGRAHWAPGIVDPSFPKAVERMLRPDERDIAEKTAAALGHMRGAYEFADILAEVAAVASSPGRVNDYRDQDSGMATPSNHDSLSPATLLIAIDHDDEQLRQLAESVDVSEPGKTIVLVRDGDSSPLYRKRIVFESVMTESEWATLGKSGYSSYLDKRIAGIARRYNTARMIAPPRGAHHRREGQ
jgi:hypothetical protein